MDKKQFLTRENETAEEILNHTNENICFVHHEWVQKTKRKCSSADCYNGRKET